MQFLIINLIAVSINYHLLINENFNFILPLNDLNISLKHQILSLEIFFQHFNVSPVEMNYSTSLIYLFQNELYASSEFKRNHTP